MEYNLELRTKEFSAKLLRFFKGVKITVINENIIRQVLRSATSIGANYREANGAVSKTDFKSKIFICKKEAKETQYWLELFEEVVDINLLIELRKIIDESKQIMLIFSKIGSSL